MDNQQTELSTNSAFNLPETYTESNYLESGKRLAKAGQFLNWQIGRWYNALEWGDKRGICTKVGINYATAKDCGSIEKKIKMSMRNDNLTFQHHKVIAIDALDDKQRTELLQQAEDKSMSSKQLTTARDVLLGRDTVKPGVDASPVQVTDNVVYEEHNPPVDEVRNYLPDADEKRQPEQSYNAAFEANKELSSLKKSNVDLVIKYDAEHLRAVSLEGDIRGLKSVIEKLEASALIDQATIDKLITEKASNKPSRKPVKKASTQYKGGAVVEILARFLPDGVSNSNNMRSALSDGYRKANGITGTLKADHAPRLNEYLEALSVDEINQLIQAKRDELRAKAKAKRLSRK